ncbi:hypothetical protein PRIPAC_70619, partial [Pristionchus pacificus]
FQYRSEMRRIRTSEDNRPTCAFEIEDMAIIQDLVICLCWSCLAEESEAFEVHVFDLLTEAWRDDVKFDRGDSVPFQPLFSLRRHRLHVMNESLMAFVLSSEEISIQLCVDRQFRLAYIIDISDMWIDFDSCMHVDGIFFSKNLERIFFYGDFQNKGCVREAVVADVSEQVGYVRPLASLETLAIWQRADEGNAVVKVVQRGDKFFVLEVGENEPAVMSFDMTTGVPAIEGLLVGDDRIKDAYPQKLYHPFNACWLPSKERLIVFGVADPHHPSLSWTIQFNVMGESRVRFARWRANKRLHELIHQADIREADPFVCTGDDLIFLNNRNKSFYRISLQEIHGKADKMQSVVRRLDYLAHKVVMRCLDPKRKPEMNGLVKEHADIVKCILQMDPIDKIVEEY